jgi:L-threonylcarbamoyladenylate synthase
LSIAVSSIDEIENIAYVDKRVFLLAKKFLPGSLTIVLKKKKNVSYIVTGGLDNVAIRIPDNKIALELLSNFGPLTCTSANIHGKKTPALINDISMQFKQKDITVFIDGGRLDGKPSTIVGLANKKLEIIREGDISKEQIIEAIQNG